jgi:hypothetical protein
VNANSAVRPGANTTKWVKNFSISFSAGLGTWRRVNISASCPASTSLGNFYLYVAADGWGGARTSAFQIQTDEGVWIAGAYAGGGGNTGWLSMTSTVNSQWNDVLYNGTTANWGYWGNGGWGATRSGNSMSGTYWNASGWGTWGYWWYGSCSTPYMVVGDKGGGWIGGGGIRNMGDPGTRHNAARNGASLTAAGVSATQ